MAKSNITREERSEGKDGTVILTVRIPESLDIDLEVAVAKQRCLKQQFVADAVREKIDREEAA